MVRHGGGVVFLQFYKIILSKRTNLHEVDCVSGRRLSFYRLKIPTQTGRGIPSFTQYMIESGRKVEESVSISY